MATKDEGAQAEVPAGAVVPVKEGKIGMAKLLVTVEEAKKILHDYVEFKRAVIMADKENYAVVKRWNPETQKEEDYTFIRKGGWQLCDSAFGISHQFLEKYIEIHDEAGWFDEPLKIPHFTYHVRYRTILPDGRFVEHEGACSTLEKRFWGKDSGAKYKDRYGAGKIYHDTKATSETRATNRGTSHAVGSGEASAEEVEEDEAAKPAITEKVMPEKEKAAREAAKNMGKIVCTTCRTTFATYELLNAHKEKEKH